MREDASMIDNPMVRDQIKARYESGERATLCAELNIGLNTLSQWAATYGWRSGAAAGLTRQQHAMILIEEGYTNATIARRLAMSADSVRGLRHKLTTNQGPRLLAGTVNERAPQDRPAGSWGGWYCGSCSWWGDSLDDYLIHKKQYERQAS
jgi:hypothetical protein